MLSNCVISHNYSCLKFYLTKQLLRIFCKCEHLTQKEPFIVYPRTREYSCASIEYFLSYIFLKPNKYLDCTPSKGSVCWHIFFVITVCI